MGSVGLMLGLGGVAWVLTYWVIHTMRHGRRPHAAPVPPSWHHDPALFGTFVWSAAGQRCPELLGVAADKVLGRPVVNYLLEQARRSDKMDACSVAEDVVASDPEEAPKEVFFKPGEPRTLEEYPGQPHTTQYLMALVSGLEPDQALPSEHQLFLGTAGQGKTLLAKCFTNELAARALRLQLPPVQFVELVPADLGTLIQQDEIIRRCLEHPTVLFIDEIHELKAAHALKLYTLLEESRYRFEGDTELTHIPELLVLAATTDYGALHAAVKRRFNRHFLEPLSTTALADVLARQPFPVEQAAATAIIARTYFSGAPWEALQVYRQAKTFAKARGGVQVILEDVERVFDGQAIDELGLARIDRRVISVLLGQPRYRRAARVTNGTEFVCYGASETDVVAMAGIDRGEYRETIKPKLMARGLLQVRPTYGQVLTEKAVSTYGWLVRDGN